MNNSPDNQFFKVYQDNQNPQTNFSEQQLEEQSTLRQPLKILTSEQNMGALPNPSGFAKTPTTSKAESSMQQSTETSQSTPTGILQFTKFPPEIQEKVIKTLITSSSPTLSILKQKAQHPITQDLTKQAKTSTLLDHTISQEFEESLNLTYVLLVCKTWYQIVAAYMTRKAVYINGPFNLQRLLLFEKRLNGFGFNQSVKSGDLDSLVNKPVKQYTFGTKYYIPDEGKNNVDGWATEEVFATPYYFDCYGEGPWWKRPVSYGLNDRLGDIYRTQEEYENWSWFSIPGWVRGRSPNIGGHLNRQGSSLDNGSSTNGSIFDCGSIMEDNGFVENDGSIKDGGSKEKGKSVENDGDDCCLDRVGMGIGAIKLDETDCEPGSFLTKIKTLILGPGTSEIHKSDTSSFISSLARGYLKGTEEASQFATYYGIPGSYLFSKIFSKQDMPASLQNLVISGHVWANPWFFLPRPVESDYRFPNLTSLTLDLPHSTHPNCSPLRTLHYFWARCADTDRHLCRLLIGRYNTDTGTTIEGGSTFLKTLKYLHIRGPGAHCCSELFEGKWEKLETVIIELPTIAAICENGTEKLITTINHTFLHLCPQAQVQVNVRAAMACHDSDFNYYFWRRLRNNLEVTESYSGDAESLVHSPDGVNVTIFSKPSGIKAEVTHANLDWITAIDNIQKEEQVYVNGAFEYFRLRDRVDTATMVWGNDLIWISAEEEVGNLTTMVENAYWNTIKNGREPNYLLLRYKADSEYKRQNREYIEQIKTTAEQGYTPVSS